MQHTFYTVLQDTTCPPHQQQFLFAEILVESAWWVLFRPSWCWFFLWPLQFIRTALTGTLDFSYPGPYYLTQEVLIHYVFFVFSVLCTKMHWRVHHLANTFGHLTVFVRTEVLVCPIYTLHEFMVPENSIRFLNFQVYSSFFLSFLCSLLLCHGSCSSVAQVFCLSPFVLLCHLSSRTALFSNGQVEFPLLVLMVPKILTFLSGSVSANLTLLKKCDDSGLSFWLKLIKLCPPTFPLGRLYIHLQM